MRRILLVFSFAFLPCPTAVSAQFETNIASDMAMSIMHNNLLQERLNDSRDDLEKDAPRNGMVVASYVPSRTVRQRNLATFVEKTRANDPAGAARMEKLFAQGDFIAQIDGHLRPLGLSANNVADAFAVYWVSAWCAAHGVDNAGDGKQLQAVSRQAAAGLAATPAFKAATDAQKQELAEAMLLQAVMIDGSMDAMGKDPAMRAKIGAAVRQGAKAMKLDLDAVHLTPAGFAPNR